MSTTRSLMAEPTLRPLTRWGQGIGTRIARLGLEYGFRDLSLRRITAEALDANTASIRILEAIGMTETGRGDAETFLGEPSYYRRFACEARAFRP
jgi:RimJ/RimL family protein N-acetyltransferase